MRVKIYIFFLLAKIKLLKTGNLEFLVDFFRFLNFEKGVYAVSIYQKGKPHIDRYHYFAQVMAKNGSDAIEKAKNDYLKHVQSTKTSKEKRA